MTDYDFDWGAYNDVMHEGELPQEDFERVYDYLLGVIKDKSRPLDERRYALEAISFSHESKVLDMIEQAYHHPDKTMNISAVFAMGRNGNLCRWEDYILEALYSSNPDMEFEAVTTLRVLTTKISSTMLSWIFWRMTVLATMMNQKQRDELQQGLRKMDQLRQGLRTK